MIARCSDVIKKYWKKPLLRASRISNAEKLDYSFRESALSLIPVCDEVVICVGPSEDGTRAIAEQLEREDSRVRIVDYPVPLPTRRITFWVEWLNFARSHLKHPMQLTLDADEILYPESYAPIRRAAEKGECAWFHRFNFWNDVKHLAPHGRVCGEQVVRLAPTNLWMCSDEPHPEGQPEYEIRTRAGWPPNAQEDMKIAHCGFLRRNLSFFEKVKAVNGAFFGVYDDRLARAEAEGVHWSTYCPFDIPLLPFNGDVPEVVKPWLRARGIEV